MGLLAIRLLVPTDAYLISPRIAVWRIRCRLSLELPLSASSFSLPVTPVQARQARQVQHKPMFIVGLSHCHGPIFSQPISGAWCFTQCPSSTYAPLFTRLEALPICFAGPGRRSESRVTLIPMRQMTTCVTHSQAPLSSCLRST